MALAIIILSCSHSLKFQSLALAPMTHEEIFCKLCNTGVTVAESPAGVAEYRFQCTQCRGAKKGYGRNRSLAISDAHTHADRRRHLVAVFMGRHETARVPPRREIELPIR